MSRHYVIHTPRRKWDDNPEGQPTRRNHYFVVHRSSHRLDRQGCLSWILAVLKKATQFLFVAAVSALAIAAIVVILVLLLRSP